MNNKVVISVADLDNHRCNQGAEGGCGICKARAEFFKRSREKWNNFWQRATQRASRKFQSDPAIVAAIFTPTEEEK